MIDFLRERSEWLENHHPLLLPALGWIRRGSNLSHLFDPTLFR